jgi:hypothetical protein
VGPAAEFDRSGGADCTGMTATLWIRRESRAAVRECGCGVCRKGKNAYEHGCAICMTLIRFPQKHATMGIPMCVACAKKAGGAVTNPRCPACLMDAQGGASSVCSSCRCSYHANGACDGGFTRQSEDSTELVCPKLVCRVAAKQGTNKCMACGGRPVQGCDPMQCVGCMRVWCGSNEGCAAGSSKPTRCKACKKTALKDANTNINLRDGGAKASRGGNQ